MNARRFFSRVGFSYFFLIVLMVGLELVADVLLDAFAPWLLNRYPSLTWIIYFLPQYVIAMPVCFLILKRLPAMQICRDHFGGARWFRMLCICLFIMEAGSIISDLLGDLISRFTPLTLSSGLSVTMSTGRLWIVFLFSVILAPVVEELIFRKALIDRAIVFGDRAAILLSGLIFGLVHGNLYQFFYAFGLGCLFAYIYIRTGRIRHTISFHMAVNFLGGFVGTAYSKVLENSMSTASFYGSMEALYSHLGAMMGLLFVRFLTYALAVAGLVLFIIFFRRRTLLPGEYSMPPAQTCSTAVVNVGMILFLAGSAFLFVISL